MKIHKLIAVIPLILLSACGKPHEKNSRLQVEETSQAASQFMLSYLPTVIDQVTYSDQSKQAVIGNDKVKKINVIVAEFHKKLISLRPEFAKVAAPYFSGYIAPQAYQNIAEVQPGCRNYQLPVKIALGAEESQKINEMKEPALFGKDGEVVLGFRDPCPHTIDLTMADLPAVIEANYIQSGCKLEMNQTSTQLVFGPGCGLSSWARARKFTHASSIVLQYAQRRILIGDYYTNRDDQMWVTVFHELGHYYLGHPAIRHSAGGSKFYFNMKERVPFTIPVALTQKDFDRELFFQLDLVYHYDRVFSARLAVAAAWPSEPLTQDQLRKNMDVTVTHQISKYSQEVIADEFGFLSREIMGFSTLSDDPLLGFRYMFRDNTSPHTPYRYDLEACERALAAKSYIPFGDFMELHPSACHRAYNVMLHRNFLYSRR